MNATKWVTLTGFIQYLGKSGKCTVDETESKSIAVFQIKSISTFTTIGTLQKGGT